MEKVINTVVKLIAQAVFSPLIYMVEHDGRVDFVYITNEQVDENILYDVQSSVTGLMHQEVDIIDIRYFSEIDKVNLLHQSKIVYCENPMLPKLLEVKVLESLKMMIEEKNSLINRRKESGCYYLQ